MAERLERPAICGRSGGRLRFLFLAVLDQAPTIRSAGMANYTEANRALFQRFPRLFFLCDNDGIGQLRVKTERCGAAFPACRTRKEAEAAVVSYDIGKIKIVECSEAEFFALPPSITSNSIAVLVPREEMARLSENQKGSEPQPSGQSVASNRVRRFVRSMTEGIRKRFQKPSGPN